MLLWVDGKQVSLEEQLEIALSEIDKDINMALNHIDEIKQRIKKSEEKRLYLLSKLEKLKS